MPSPFERVFNPDREGTLFGTVGAALGNPTSGDRTAAAMGVLNDLHQKGASPQQAIVQLMQRPEGQDFMGNTQGGNPVDILSKWVTMVTPPKPTMTTVNPGQGLYADGKRVGGEAHAPQAVSAGNSMMGPDGTVLGTAPLLPGQQAAGNQVLGPSQTLVNPQGSTLAATGAAPTEAVNTFQGLSEAAKKAGILNDNQIGLIAEEMLNPKGVNFRRLTEIGVPPDIAEKIRQGLYVPRDRHNSAGQKIGVDLMDQTTGQTIGGQNVVVPQAARGPQAGVPVVMSPDLDKVLRDPKESMALGNGLNTAGHSLIATVNRQLGPEYSDPKSEINVQRNQSLAALDASLALDPGEQGRIAAQLKTLKGLVPGFYTDPAKSVSNLMTMRNNVEEWRGMEAKVVQEGVQGGWASETVRKSMDDMLRWDRVLATMPSMAGLEAQAKALRGGSAGIPTMTDTARTAVGTAGNVAGAAVNAAGDAVGAARGGDPSAQPVPRQAPSATAAQTKAVEPQKEDGNLIKAIGSMDGVGLKTLDLATLGPHARAAVRSRIQALQAKVKPTATAPRNIELNIKANEGSE